MNPFTSISFLTKINQLFKQELNIEVKIGFEQEFYYAEAIDELEKQYPEFHFEAENGPNQYEAITEASFEIERQCEAIIALRSNLSVNVSALISSEMPSSALNLSVSLWRGGQNLLAKKLDGSDSKHLLWAVAGLEDLANDFINVYCPTENSFARIKEANDHVPTKVCWGYNNRTAAFRIPTTDPHLIRIENRIISSDASPIAACAATLYSIYHGIKEQITLHHKIYGDSGHEQYQLIKLIDNLDEAENRLELWNSKNHSRG